MQIAESSESRMLRFGDRFKTDVRGMNNAKVGGRRYSSIIRRAYKVPFQIDIFPEWGLQYDQRNMQLGVQVDRLLGLSSVFLFFWK